MRNTKVILNMSCSNHSIQGEGEPRRRVPQCSLPKLRVSNPPWSKSNPKPSVTAYQGKEPQTTVTHAFIQHVKPVMMYTDDARTASLNVECHHSLRVWEQLAGDGWWETGYTRSLQAYDHQPIEQNLINWAKGTVGSMWHSPPGSPAWPHGGCFI